MLSSVFSLAALLPLLVAGSPASLASRSLVARQDPVVFDTVTVFVTPLESLEGVVPDLPKDQNLVLVPGDEKLQQFVVGRGFQVSSHASPLSLPSSVLDYLLSL